MSKYDDRAEEQKLEEARKAERYGELEVKLKEFEVLLLKVRDGALKHDKRDVRHVMYYLLDVYEKNFKQYYGIKSD